MEFIALSGFQWLTKEKNMNTTRPLQTHLSNKKAKDIFLRNALQERRLSEATKEVDKSKQKMKSEITKAKKQLEKKIGKRTEVIISDNELRSHSFGSFFKEQNSDSLLPHKPRTISESGSHSSERSPRLLRRSTLANCAVRPPSELRRQVILSQTREKGASASNYTKENLKENATKTDSALRRSDPAIPVILIEGDKSKERDEKPTRKTSFERSLSTGDLQSLVRPTQGEYTSLFPLHNRRRTSSASSAQADEVIDSLNQCVCNFLQVASPQLRPRRKVYSEEPFYLKKSRPSSLILPGQQPPKGLHNGDDLVNNTGDMIKEKPLKELLPPIVLPSIYQSEEARKKCEKGNEKNRQIARKKARPRSAEIDVDRLVGQLKDCRYLRLKSEK